MKRLFSVLLSCFTMVSFLILFNGTAAAQSPDKVRSDNTSSTDVHSNTQATMDRLTFSQIKALLDVADDAMGSDDTNTRTQGEHDADSVPSDDDNERTFGFAEMNTSNHDVAAITRLTLRQIQAVIDNANLSDDDTRSTDGDPDSTNSDDDKTRDRTPGGADKADGDFGFGDNRTGDDSADRANEMTLRQIAALLDVVNPTRDKDSARKVGTQNPDKAVLSAQEKIELIWLIVNNQPISSTTASGN